MPNNAVQAQGRPPSRLQCVGDATFPNVDERSDDHVNRLRHEISAMWSKLAQEYPLLVVRSNFSSSGNSCDRAHWASAFQQSSSRGAHVVHEGQLRHDLHRHVRPQEQSTDRSWPGCHVRPCFVWAKFGQISTGIGQFQPKFDRTWQNNGQTWPTWATFGRN